MESIGKVDLRGCSNNVTRSPYEQNGNTQVCIFTAQNHDDARSQAERTADKRLEKIAYKAIEINDRFTDNYFNMDVSMPLQGAYEDVCGGYLRQRAYNTLHQAKTHEAVKPGELPDAKTSRFMEKFDAFVFGLMKGKNMPTEGFTAGQLSSLARYTFQGNPTLHRLYMVPAKSNADNVAIYEAIIKSENYNAIADEKNKFNGFQLNSYEIPKEYQSFVGEYLSGRESLSETEAARFIEITKALESVNAYNKPQQHDSAVTVKKEDIDFFDTSGDCLLNRGDVSAIELFLKAGTDREIQEALLASKKEDWNNLSFLKTVSKSKNDKTTKNLFDLNGDGNADEQDYELYQNILRNPCKTDINADGFVDGKDVALINEYFKAILERVKESETYRQNFEKIAGGKEYVNRLQKKLYE
ncbi:MAG: hypothetical protein K6A44_02205 [bacterium]|nr:hypothetical protein [bacterium]